MGLKVTLMKPDDYPIHAFPSIVANAIKKSAFYHNVPLAVAAQAYLGALVYMAQSKVNAPSDKDENGQPSSLFLLTVFPSGEGKDVCKRDAYKIIMEIEKENIKQFKAEEEKQKKLQANKTLNIPMDPTSFFKKATTQGIISRIARSKNVSFMWVTGEGGYLFNGYSLTSKTAGESLSIINDLVDTGATSSTLNNQEDCISFEDKRFSLEIAVQNVVAKPALTNELLMAQGFLARVQFAAPDVLPHRTITLESKRIKPYDDQDLIAYWEFCRRKLLDSNQYSSLNSKQLFIIKKTEEAELKHIEYENYIGEEVATGRKYSFIRPYARRTTQYVLRVAAVLAYASDLREINAEIMSNAIDLCKYSLNQWVKYYTADDKANSEELLKWLCKQPLDKILKSDILQEGPKKFRNATERDKALDYLEQINQVSIQKIDGKDYVILSKLKDV